VTVVVEVPKVSVFAPKVTLLFTVLDRSPTVTPPLAWLISKTVVVEFKDTELLEPIMPDPDTCNDPLLIAIPPVNVFNPEERTIVPLPVKFIPPAPLTIPLKVTVRPEAILKDPALLKT